MRTVARLVRRSYRMATSSQRPLPEFVVIGAQKSGTTSLYRYLVQHPQVRPPLTKEVHFFDVNWQRGEGWYRSNFPQRSEGAGWVTGEATPAYLFHPMAAERAAEVIPGSRFLVVLRNPIDRAYSHYHHERAKGRETLSFAEALANEEERLEGERSRLIAEPGYFSYAHRHHSYTARGRYAEQLEEWFKHFPRRQFLILQSERLFADPRSAVAAVAEFLGLQPPEGEAWEPHNTRSYQDMEPGIREQLSRVFAPHNERLYALLDESFDWV
jgi:hypothetical protein